MALVVSFPKLADNGSANEFDVTATPNGRVAGDVRFLLSDVEVVDQVAATPTSATFRAKADGVEGKMVSIACEVTTPSGAVVAGNEMVEVTLVAVAPEATELIVTVSPVRPSA